MKELPLISLFGDREENLYQLGLKDRHQGLDFVNHCKTLVRTRLEVLNKTYQRVFQGMANQIIKKQPQFAKPLMAYAEGLGWCPRELALAYLSHEFLGFMNKWALDFSSPLLGCSSFFTWDDKREALIHGRIFDYPLMDCFDIQERALLTQFKSGPAILSFGSSGFPYPSLTCQTSTGISLALHRKVTSFFDFKGMPIFELIFQMLQTCSHPKEVIAFLKKSRTLTCWGLYMGFSSGEVLAADLMGEELFYQTYRVEPQKVLYFCNQLEKDALSYSHCQPLGLDHYNQMRCDSAKKKMKKQSYSMEKLMVAMGNLGNQKAKSTRLWKADPLAPSTLQVVTLCPEREEALFMPGLSPKYFRGKVISLTRTFEEPQIKVKKLRGSVNCEKIWQGQRFLMKAQMVLDQNQLNEAYHFIQIAIIHGQNRPEGQIAHFFFLVLRYMNETHFKDRNFLLREFRKMESQLPPYLNDHCLLFIARLEKILRDETHVKAQEIQNPHLQSLFLEEMKLPSLILHKLTSFLMSPRMDLLDIIYGHGRLLFRLNKSQKMK